jgi:hypothetical protein
MVKIAGHRISAINKPLTKQVFEDARHDIVSVRTANGLLRPGAARLAVCPATLAAWS